MTAKLFSYGGFGGHVFVCFLHNININERETTLKCPIGSVPATVVYFDSPKVETLVTGRVGYRVCSSIGGMRLTLILPESFKF